MYFRKKKSYRTFCHKFQIFLIFYCSFFLRNLSSFRESFFYTSCKEIKERVFVIFTDSVNTRIRILLDSLEFFDSSLGKTVCHWKLSGNFCQTVLYSNFFLKRFMLIPNNVYAMFSINTFCPEDFIQQFCVVMNIGFTLFSPSDFYSTFFI